MRSGTTYNPSRNILQDIMAVTQQRSKLAGIVCYFWRKLQHTRGAAAWKHPEDVPLLGLLGFCILAAAINMKVKYGLSCCDPQLAELQGLDASPPHM